MPSVISNRGELSPILRLLRVPLRGLLVLVLIIQGKYKTQKKDNSNHNRNKQHIKITIRSLDDGGYLKEFLDNQSFLLENDGASLWIDIQNLAENIYDDDWDLIKAKTEIEPEDIKRKLIRGSFPRIDHISIAGKEFSTIRLWDSPNKSTDDTESRILVVFKDSNIVTLRTDINDLFDRIPR